MEDLDVDSFSSAEELAKALGTDGLKVELGKRQMKSGGTDKQRSERLFACKGKKLEDLPKKFFVKGAVVGDKADTFAGGDSEVASASAVSKKDIAVLEAVTVGLLVQLRPVLDGTARR